ITGKIFSLAALKDPKNISLVKEAKKRLSDIFDAGTNVVRMNFSHGDHEEQMVRVILTREVAAEKKINVSLLLDTKGPEIRVYKIKNDELDIKNNALITISTKKKVEGSGSTFSVYDSTNTYNMAIDVKVGDIIYVDDGKLKLIAESVDVQKGEIKAIAKNNHKVRGNKRINLPNANYSIPFLSDKDKNDVLFAIENDFNYIAASFVNSAKNVREIKEILASKNCTKIQIISKIETMNSIQAILEIIDESDGIMIARGDLGLEIPYYEVPYYEKYIIKACRHKAKPVIVATQMLDSLETKMQATRAEVTDVFYAVEKGADSTMLSGETASGMYPVNAVEVMSIIDKYSEKLFDYDRAINIYFKHTDFYRTRNGKIARKVAKIVAPFRDIDNTDFQYSAIMYFGDDVDFIKALSNIRVAAPIFVITNNIDLKNYFGIYYAVNVEIIDNFDEILVDFADCCKKILIEKNIQLHNIIVIINKKVLKLNV
ncbi:MAG: pyruvate kinase, partial [Malacoplasma sp.]